jgi:hypothetical protein
MSRLSRKCGSLNISHPHGSPQPVTGIPLLTFTFTIYLPTALQLFIGDLGHFLSFLILVFYTADRTPWTGDQPVARPSSTHRTTQTQNKCAQWSMPQVQFECTIPVFERAKIINVLDCAATVIDLNIATHCKLKRKSCLHLIFTCCSLGSLYLPHMYCN